MLDERGDVPDEAWLNIEDADFDPATLGRELNETMSQAEIEERFFANATRFGPQLRNEFVARCRYAAPAAAMRSLLDDLTAEPISAPRAILRTVGCLFAAAPAGMGLLWGAFSPQRRGWQDYLASTRVISDF